MGAACGRNIDARQAVARDKKALIDVGVGNGRYVAVQKLVYVGEGQGDYHQDDEPEPQMPQASSVGIRSAGTYAATAVLTLVLVAFALMMAASVLRGDVGSPFSSTGETTSLHSNEAYNSTVGLLPSLHT
mmetsp:Transcript_6014/g.16677  ORF Transcript_6014/g.16677 Transcript_6014/m.16677 type:complete len:130 (+) Transcript_6014:331-720(+)